LRFHFARAAEKHAAAAEGRTESYPEIGLKNNRRILVFLNMSKPGKPGACSFSLYHCFYIVY